MKKKKNILVISLIIIFVMVVIFIISYFSNNNKLMDISSEDKQDLMKLLDIDNSTSFLPISISKKILGFGESAKCYILKFEISVEDYNNNDLNYKDIDTTETSLNWKERKDEQTYTCYVREWEYNEYRKKLFNKLQELVIKY